MLKGNKGEWSEIYTLFKILSEGKLYGGDSNIQRIADLTFPIIKILRSESQDSFEFSYDQDIVVVQGTTETFRIPVFKFHEQASLLLRKIKSENKGNFSLEETESFLNSFKCRSLKASSADKSDIRIVIHDKRTGTTPELGFSIKSQLGGASTLLNAGKTTNFIYRIVGASLTQDQIHHVNSLIISRGKKEHKDVRGRVNYIFDKGRSLQFVRNENITFQNNLTLIDSNLPRIFSDIVLQYFQTANSKLLDLVKELTDRNPLNYNCTNGHPFYSYKIKRFLSDIALGMMPSKVWTGELDATGGYLVVKEDGEIVCYHIYNRNEFEDYLINNTKLETASSTRHDFGTVFSEGNENFIKLNLQIRFLK